VRKTLARAIGRGDSLEGDPGSARRRATEQREEIAAFIRLARRRAGEMIRES
jgi:hypothetical protein